MIAFLMLCFSNNFTSQICFRTALAAIHYNYNIHREAVKGKDGKDRSKVVHPKFKNGETTVRSISVPPNFGKHFTGQTSNSNDYNLLAGVLFHIISKFCHISIDIFLFFFRIY